jgi:pyruvate dehydrogenase E1 component beta subunit
VVRPTTPADAKGLLKSAIRDDNPVIFIEAETLYAVKGEVPDDPDFTIPLGKAIVRREGTDVTVVAYMGMMYRAMEVAEELAKEGISCELVDPRTLRPMDTDTIVSSVRKTHRPSCSRRARASRGWARRSPPRSPRRPSTIWTPR